MSKNVFISPSCGKKIKYSCLWHSKCYSSCLNNFRVGASWSRVGQGGFGISLTQSGGEKFTKNGCLPQTMVEPPKVSSLVSGGS